MSCPRGRMFEDFLDDDMWRPLSPRELAAAQGFAEPRTGPRKRWFLIPRIAHDLPPRTIEVENVSGSADVASAFAALASSPVDVTWESPPCEHFSKGGR